MDKVDAIEQWPQQLQIMAKYDGNVYFVSTTCYPVWRNRRTSANSTQCTQPSRLSNLTTDTKLYWEPFHDDALRLVKQKLFERTMLQYLF